MDRKGQGAKVPGSDLARVLLADSLQGANWPGSEKAMNHVFWVVCADPPPLPMVHCKRYH